MKRFVLALTALVLSACAAQQQREVNAAYVSAQQEKARALIACATRPDQVAECGLMVAAVYGGGGTDSVPVVRSDLDVVLNSSVAGAAINAGSAILQSNNAREVALAQTDAQVRMAESADARQVGIVQAATGSNATIAGAGFSAIGGVATAGIGALAQVADGANSANVANSQAWAGALAALPPTTQTIAGGNVTQSGRDTDQSTTGRNRTTGDGNEVERQVQCSALGGLGGNAAGTTSASSAGTTNPVSTAYNALSGGSGAPASNNCGG